MRGVAYDTAQTARLGGGSVFPRALLWLISSQRPDGSWGEEHLYYHDRVISTLASVVALAEINRSKYEKRIRAGLDYLWENSERVKEEQHSTVGFELIYPSLLEEALALGLDVPMFGLSHYTKLRDEKLEPILTELLYSAKTTVTFSAEFMSNSVNPGRIAQLISSMGCVGNSPSATAYVLKHIESRKALSYLAAIENDDGSMPDVYPFEIFEKAWLIYNFLLSGQQVNDQTLVNLEYLRSCLTRDGVGISKISSVTDSDDTALVLEVLRAFNYEVDSRILESFEADDRFLCFHFERDPSVSANIHVLQALQTCRRTPKTDQMIDKAIRFLQRTRLSGTHWKDKWHISPYYATGNAILTLLNFEPAIAGKAVDWIIGTQNSNGSWGLDGGTPEETAYALQALFCYNQIERIDFEPILRAMTYLSEYDYRTRPVDALWIGKALYAPEIVAKSAIQSVFYMFRKVKGG